MTRLKKLYELLAIISGAESGLFARASALKLSQKDQKRLKVHAKAVTDAMQKLSDEIEVIIGEVE